MPKGSCWCKKVQYEINATEPMNVICHCPTCAKITSSAFSTCISVPKSSLHILPSPSTPSTTPSVPPSSTSDSSLVSAPASTQYMTSPSLDPHPYPNSYLKTYSAPHTPTGMGLTVYFCCHCGTALYKEVKDAYVVFAGTLDEDADEQGGWKPKGEIWTTYRASWLKPLEGVKQWKGFPE